VHPALLLGSFVREPVRLAPASSALPTAPPPSAVGGGGRRPTPRSL